MHMYTNVYNTVPSHHKYMYQPRHNRITGTTNCTLEDGGIQCTSRFNFVLVESKLEILKLLRGLNIKMYPVYIQNGLHKYSS